MWNGTTIKIDLILIRHGITESNCEHRYLGQTDEPLSKHGISQFMEQKKSMNLPKPELVLVSPMKRCQESASLLFEETGQYVVEEWREMDFGLYEGKNFEELKEDSYYQRWIVSNGTLPFPGGESQTLFIERCIQGLNYARAIIRLKSESCKEEIKTDAEDNATICVAAVVHGGTIMALMSTLNHGEYYDYQVTNGNGYRCQLLDSVNDLNLISMNKLIVNL